MIATLVCSANELPLKKSNNNGTTKQHGQYAQTLSPGLIRKMTAYWHAANYLSVGQIYLYDNPLVEKAFNAGAY